MANAEHLAILEKGVEAWNEWRRENPEVAPDLTSADLSRAKLSGANLSGANLNMAVLSGADLSEAYLGGARLWRADLSRAGLFMAYLGEANLSEANLSEADLSMAVCGRANLSKADLSKADFRGASFSMVDLSAADLSEAKLSKADFSQAYLIEADLTGADLSEANFSWAYLNKADLTSAHVSGARLSRADFSRAYLIEADLSEADFDRAYLIEADLTGAKLQDVDIRYAQLSECNLTRAKLTGARLYATARDNWIIEGIECRYVFWDEDGKTRSPEDRDLAPGEFERLYRTLPTIEYVFQNGMTPMDPLIMDRVVEAIREQSPQFDLQIDSISARGLAPSIKFTVQQEEHKEPALQMIVAGYESRVQRLEAEKDRLYDLLALAIDKPGTRLLVAGHDIITAEGNATINIDQHIEYITNLRDAVAAQPEDSETFAKVAKKTALDIIGSALKDVAKGQVKKAAEQIIELCKDLGPVILNTAAYAFFKNIMQGG